MRFILLRLYNYDLSRIYFITIVQSQQNESYKTFPRLLFCAGVCAMCGKQVLDVTYYRQSGGAAPGNKKRKLDGEEGEAEGAALRAWCSRTMTLPYDCTPLRWRSHTKALPYEGPPCKGAKSAQGERCHAVEAQRISCSGGESASQPPRAILGTNAPRRHAELLTESLTEWLTLWLT